MHNTPRSPAPPMTEQELYRTIVEERRAAAHYDRLLKMHPCTESAAMLTAMRDEEWAHAEKLLALYRKLFRRDPVLPAVSLPAVADLAEGLALAVPDEWDIYTQYRDWYLASVTPALRDLFFELMTDENKHAGKLNVLSANET